MLRHTLLGIVLLLSFAKPAFASSWLDRSYGIFFPPALRENVSVSQVFPVFWWNFVVYDLGEENGASWKHAQELCKKLKAMAPRLLLRAECNQDLRELESFATDWAQDLPLRAERPSDTVLREKLDGALAKASLPMGDRSLINVLRADPTESWQELRRIVEGRLKIRLERKQGFFYDSTSHRVVIPVQAAFAPTETLKTREIIAELAPFGPQTSLIGSHGSTLRNEEQISRDLAAVSRAGYVILALLGAFLFAFRRWRLLLLFPPVFLAVAIGAGVTVLLFGSIHGLTLSLGAGIIGLALDYGFNGALADRASERLTWRSNLIGLVTTLAGLLVLMTSSIPLLRQMMVFASSGLVAGYVIFWLLIRRFPGRFQAKPIGVRFAPKPAKTAVIAGLVAASAAGFFLLHPNLDMKQFDFQDDGPKAVSDWLFKTLELHPPLFTLNSGEGSLDRAHQELAWAQGAGVGVENIANYFPRAQDQRNYLLSWSRTACAPLVARLNEGERKFFSSFIDHELCHPPSPRLAGAALNRAYTAHLSAGDRWLTLWTPATDTQDKQIQAAYPEAHALREIVLAFPQTLNRELSWMVPLSVLLVLVILLIYYRRVSYSLIALTPFLGGLGLFTLAALAFKLQVSFISVIALVMCFGFSFDYAIFAVDHYARGVAGEKDGVWEAISTAACATLAGFVPLLFCRHPVLCHLGQALCISTAGCYLGAVWGVPGLMMKARGKT